MRNGWGNWLANQINDARRIKNSFQQANAHRFATLHTEFLFYDGSLGREAPSVDATTLHVFKDWGVVKYGTTLAASSNTLKTESTSFLSFKCGVLHGMAINRIVKTRPWNWIEGLRNFNPGHEHPDHGSFTYYTNGLPFVTDALYGPKNIWLNNVVMFGTGDRFEGQIGEGTYNLNNKVATNAIFSSFHFFTVLSTTVVLVVFFYFLFFFCFLFVVVFFLSNPSFFTVLYISSAYLC